MPSTSSPPGERLPEPRGIPLEDAKQIGSNVDPPLDESLPQDFKPLDAPHFRGHPILVFACLMHGKAWFLQPDVYYDLDDMVEHLATERDPTHDVDCEVHHSIVCSYRTAWDIFNLDILGCRG